MSKSKNQITDILNEEIDKILSEILFESPKFASFKKGKSVKFIGYHWSDKKLVKPFVAKWKKGKLKDYFQNNGGFFISDNEKDWASPWMKTPQVLLKTEISVSKPFITNDQLESLLSNGFVDEIMSKGFDSIFSIPGKKDIMSTKQGLIFYPNKQIKKIEITK